MSFHKWRRLPTKHFGEVWVPFAHIQLHGTDGTLHDLAIQIDSGAVVSLLARSVADLLQLDLESGQPVTLGSVGGSQTTAFVHEIETGLAEGMRAPVRFAIATNETVPNLLGRLDIFDRLQVDFDASLTHTGFLGPWADEDRRRIYEFLFETEKHILQRLQDLPFPDPAPEALRRLVNRMEQLYVGAVGLIKLHRCYSGPLFIRAMFEVWLQVAYILEKPNERASAYLDFAHIARHRESKAILENPTGPIGKDLASSPRRKESEKRNEAEYERVKGAFETKNKKGKTDVAMAWHKKSFFRLAEDLGFASEYRLVYTACSGWAHANPFHANETHVFSNPRVVFLYCTGMHARMLKCIADHGKVILTAEQDEFLTEMSATWH